MRLWKADARQTRIDAGYALGALLGGVVLALLGAYGSNNGVIYPLEWRLLPLGLGALAILLRRGMPMVTLYVGFVAFAIDAWMGLSAAGFLIFEDNVYSAVAYGWRRLHWWLGGLTLTGGVAAGLWFGTWAGEPRWGILLFLIVVGIMATPVLTGLLVRMYRDRADIAREHAAQVARLSEMDRRGAVNAERTRMARELHDLVANQFSAIAVQSAALLSRPDLDAATSRRVLDTIRDNSVQGLSELRNMIELLRSDDETVDEPVSHRLSEADRLVGRHRDLGLDVELLVTGEPRELPAAVDLAGYRIMQESLVNAGKYGDGSAVVRVDYAPRLVTITVDSPPGVVVEEPIGVNARAGLVGMRERAQLLGGTFRAGREESVWRVHVELPVMEETT
ncbi:sensor histidine kinase [Phytomonospora endophytica]|uniref:histidine kinase n=1 Tax=Phytomonospora endophytica TaxID=714109 RepID=A0A841FHE5_9ACTN|nr:histidine kinase [Phytomonospora endophytica]MBB6035155.1 signal transduction histidine kinase [Phytomonospora endophytica]